MIVIDFLYSLIGMPLGYIMWVCYLLVNNFGLAIIIFTVLVKGAMFPLNLRQQRNMAKSQLFAPRVKELQQKYRNDQQKLQDEMSKLQKEGYNPMGGCGSMLLTMLLLFGVIDVVYKPMTHMEHLDWGQSGTIATVVSTAKQVEFTSILLASPDDKQAVLDFIADSATIKIVEDNAETADIDESVPQIKITMPEGETFDMEAAKQNVKLTAEDIKNFTLTDEQITTLVAGDSRLSAEVKSALSTARANYSTSLRQELSALRTYTYHDYMFTDCGISDETLTKLDNLSANMYFLGIDLGATPTLSWNILILVPILSFVLSLVSMIISQYIQKRTNPAATQMGGGMKAIIYIMPLFSLYIAFIVPAGVGFYWGISYLFGIAQSIITYKVWPPEKLKAEAEAALKAKGAQLEVKATIVDVDENGNEIKRVERISQLTQKELAELNRKKLEEARKADAEKYADETIPELPPLEEDKKSDNE